MADTDTETLPNGTEGLSEEDERLKQRPADIDADVREMERRKRVEALMSSKLFREELERVLDQQIHEGSDAPLLQRIREMVGGRLHTGSFRGPSCVLPINDIRGIEGVGYEKGEKILRCKLAAVYRLVDLFGWTQTGITGQITARLNTAVEQVLTTPRGLLPHEVTASSLVKVDMQGTVQDQGTTNFPVNVEGFSLHASVHAARPDVRCVLHVRSPAALAVSSMKRGLLPLCHEAALLGDVAYHRVPYGPLDNEERDKLVRALGPHAKVLMLASGGALCCGATLEEAFSQARHLTAACDVQLRVAALPLDELQLIDDETAKQMYEAAHRPPAEGGSKWRVGGEEFEALMRMLDNAGFRTGYIYRHPLIKNDVPKPKNDVEVPPAVSSLGYLLEEEELYRQGIWKKGTGTRGERTRWLNSPNVYQKVEMLETGTTDPKKITKWVDANNDEWVQDGSPAHSSTPVKIDTLQFVPMKTNPKEFKKLQQQIKDNRRADKISAGPQSHILEGVTWDEASKLVSEDANTTHTGDHVVLMGAASKGIIQRGYQHNATVYSAPYARNPFDHVTDREIQEYRRVVERKQRSDYDTDLSESEAISAAQITSPASATETEEESRDEHRVLRIETKQVPVRSQPEVVLSDDFLNAERAHADRTKGTEKRNTATNTLNEAMSSSKRSLHGYPRVNGLENIIKKFDSPDKAEKDDSKRPKCKINLNSQLENVKFDALDIYNRGIASSRSSLYSIPSLDWDGRCKSEYLFRTQSLPRQKSKPNANKLYRTRSHSGFVNAHIKDPDPLHYHLPKCRSCGATNSSYVWELCKEEIRKKVPTSMYFSVDDLPRKCLEEREANVVKISEKVVPVFKVAKPDEEFVESQEFNEENDFGDIGNSFSSENRTVVEKGNDEQEDTYTEETLQADCVPEKTDLTSPNDDVEIRYQGDVHRAELVPVIPIGSDKFETNAVDAVEGEYQSFTDDIDFDDSMYESPVKNLVEKDIRDYSVPLDLYYDGTKGTPEKKRREVEEVGKATVLEPILEESKSSYGDDSRNSSGNHGKVSNDESDFLKINIGCDNAMKEREQREEKEKYTTRKNISKESQETVGVKANQYASESFVLIENKVQKEEELQTPIDTNTEYSYACRLELEKQAESTDLKSEVVQNVLDDIFTKTCTAAELRLEISFPDPKKMSPVLLEMECRSKQESFVLVDEDIDFTSNDIESITTNIEQTAVDMYSESEIEETDVEQEQLFDSLFQILSTDAVNCDTVQHVPDEVDVKDEIQSFYSVASSVPERLSFETTVEFEKYEIVADVLTKVLDKIDIYSFNRQFQNFSQLGQIDNRLEVKTVVSKIDLCYEPQDSDNLAPSNEDSYDTEETCRNIEYKEMNSENYANFSITTMIKNLEQSVNLNETVLTEYSDTESSFTYKIVESMLYYILDRAFFFYSNKNKCKIIKKSKQVITVVDKEDILYTAVPLWSEINQKDLSTQDEISQSKELKLNDIETCLDSYINVKESELIYHGSLRRKSLESYFDGAHIANESVKSDLRISDVIHDAYETVQTEDVNVTSMSIDLSYSKLKLKEHYFAVKVKNSVNDCKVNEGWEVQINEAPTKSVEITENVYTEVCAGDQVIVNEKDNNETDYEENLTFDNFGEDYQFTDESINEDSRSRSYEMAGDIICEMLERHVVTVGNSHAKRGIKVEAKRESTIENFLNETFILEQGDMNTAFVVSESPKNYYSRSSSPHKEAIFDACTESPIKSPNERFIGEDLSVLYEKDETILGSPFVKTVPVISMSQTVHSGGIKYWVSFDESLTMDSENERPVNKSKPIRNLENKIPSFVVVDLSEAENKNKQTNDCLDIFKKATYRRSSILIDDFNESDEVIRADTYATPSASDYRTCDSDLTDANVEDGPQKRLLYDSRVNLQRRTKRQYFSWPPFYDTLFYRIISKFRMSESFDPSDLKSIAVDSTTSF